jgi:uncharacterized protein YbaR (Trm112 family)
MISEQLLGILVCPENRTPLSLAPVEMVKALNEAITAGRLTNRGGERVEQPLDGALVRADGTIAYPVVDDIPVMLVDAGIELAQIRRADQR